MPAALTVWAAALAVIVFGAWVGLAVAAGATVTLMMCRQAGQAVLSGGLGACAAAMTWWRVSLARAHDVEQGARTVAGTVAGSPRRTRGGSWLVELNVDGYPESLPVFTEQLPAGVVSGASVVVRGRAGESSQPGVGAVTYSGDLHATAPPQGFAAFAAHVRHRFTETVETVVGEHANGLIPGMVLGDTSLQSPEETQAYVDTGLSHLSAVSGANCMYVATAALVAARVARLGLRGQLGVAGAALAVYAGLIGPEPSVLRATMSGLVGLVAVLASTRAEPMHALCLSVIGLVLVDSDLAADYAFALSVAATVGIVAVSPLIYRGLAVTGWLDILVRVLAVAIAADLATAPLIAAMAGRVSVVSVVANVLVSPVTGVVTVLGMAAAILAQIHVLLATPLLWVLTPLAGWVRTVAEAGAALPGATVAAEPLTVVVVYGWIVAGFLARRPRVTLACVGAALAVWVV